MKILFVIPTYKPAYVYGGPVVVVSILAESLAKNGHDVTVYTTTANGKTELDVETDKLVMIDGVKVFYFKRYTKDHSHLSPGFWKKIYSSVGSFDIVHLHSWWNPAIVIAAGICKLKGVKPVLSPHGMFCDYVLDTKNKLKKQALHLVSKLLLTNTWLHVSTLNEWKESQKMLPTKWDGVIIPNLVILNGTPDLGVRQTNEIFTIGFISRVDPKKGLDLLIKALAKVTFNYTLKIAGSGENDYIADLKNLSVEMKNHDRIQWLGWKDNVQKFEFYKAIDLFALTSRNENFAVVVIESLSVGTPVFLSSSVGLSDYAMEKGLGWITSTDPDEIAKDLELAFSDHKTRSIISEKAPAIIARDYEIDQLTKQYVDYYQSVI
ncbi:XrtY-associated glycosyltransferase XYAG1 [Mucilaginibacter myungsuensis]|uniref:Glycosyltransferase n=1 Tax=Mucilaginibacter myungsuensis TaxID=649104 RepID=A0A929KRY8_9SPHI|nr:glycosyltransferase [Mucilaginibacter myungsuensis]MBE9660399.1 glycosyltransferase [Mucilaginibacter myungsuensis]MDN3600442.1 glycosyltransferase [Mucilaginibacter myungsuensis]